MIYIYHNPRCRKSREGVSFLEDSGEDFLIKEYLKEPLTEEELRSLLKKLHMSPIELVRVKEPLWKEKYKDKDLSDSELLRVLAENPKLIERPIIVKDDRAVIGRPAEKIAELLN